MRGSVSDHEGGWNDESWGFSQAATNNPKKLKKSKSKEETTPGWAVIPPITSLNLQGNTDSSPAEEFIVLGLQLTSIFIME